MPPPDVPLGLAPSLLESARDVAGVDDPLHLVGETGSGKTHFARVVHALSRRGKNNMISVNCAAFPGDMLDAELHGAKKGAFTGAHESRTGLIEAADMSTLFLDEIGHIPLNHQPKLLRVVEEKRVRQIGSSRERKVDFRLITAAAIPLDELIARGHFLPELKYRVDVLRLEIPPLRERRDAIPALADYFVRRRPEYDSRAPTGDIVDPRAVECLAEHDWPGNIRELQNVVAASAVSARGRRILPKHVRAALEQRVGAMPAAPRDVPQRRRYRSPGDPDVERRQIAVALESEKGNITRAAKRLGMARNTLLWKIDRYQIKR